jgi:retinol dehydrogenase-14
MKTVLITGATGAIGKATAMELAKNKCSLILLGRNSEKLNALKAEIAKTTGNTSVDVFIAELSEPASIARAAEEIKKKYTAINALINIAAIYKAQRAENSKGHEYMFATNHLGPFVLTNQVQDLLKAGKPSRVVTVTAPSTTKVNFDDIHGKQKFNPGFMGIFGATKMMNLMFTYSLAEKLKGSGVTTSAYHPGLVKTELTKDMGAFLNFIFGMMSSAPDKAAKMLAKAAIDPAYENSNGTFLKFDGKEIKSSAYSYDKAVQDKLWKLSEQLTL